MGVEVVGFLPTACGGCGMAGPIWCDECDARIRGSGPLPPQVWPAVALGRYDGPLRNAVAALKFRGAAALAAVLGRRLAESLPDDDGGFTDVDCVCPVPTSSRRRRVRGYDQATLLAEAVGRALGVEVVSPLWRTPGHEPQQALDRAGRLSPVPHRFLLDVSVPQRILLVDDVVTTGATLASAMRLLRAHGATVSAAVVAATPAGRNGPGQNGSSGPQENVTLGRQ